MLDTQEMQLKRRARELEILAAQSAELFRQGSIQDIFDTAGNIIYAQLGYTCTLFSFEPEGWRLRFISIPENVRELSRKLTGLDPDDFVMSGEFSLYQRLERGEDAFFLEDSQEYTMEGLQLVYRDHPDRGRFLARGLRAMATVVTQRILPALNKLLIVAPMYAGNELFGNITLFGDNLGVDDVPTVKHFANLIGTAVWQKRAEQALAESEKRYRTLFSNAAEGIVVADVKDRVFRFANAALCRMLGYSEASLQSMSIAGIHPPEFREKAIAYFDRHATDDSAALEHVPCLKKDGSVIFVDIKTTHMQIDGRSCCVGFFTDITKRRMAEIALNESEATARALISAPTDVAMLIDPAGIILDLNETAATRFSQSREAMIGTFVLDYFPPDVAAVREKVFLRIIETKKPLRVEDARQGIWNDTVIYPVLDNAGNVSRIAILARDITLRKQTEEQLRRSEENFRSLSEEITDGMVVHVDGQCCWCNRAFTDIFGVTREHLIGGDITHLIAPEHRDQFVRRSRLRLEGKDVPDHYETVGLHADGSRFDVEMVAKKITFDGSLAVLLLARDITERKRSEEALLKSERRYRSVIEDVDALICRFTPNGILTFVNEEYCNYFKMTRGDLLGRSFFEFIPDDDREEIRDRYLSLTRNDPTITYEHRVIGANGIECWQRWTDRALFDGQGRLVEFQSIGFDTTEQRQVEERVTALSRKVISSQELERARLSRELHDEMGQQLSAIQLVLESMLSRPQPDRDYIELIAERIEDLTMEVRRICKGLRPVILDTFGFHMSLENLVHEFRDNFDMNIQYIVSSREKHMMPPEAAISTYRIAQEALTNAMRYAPDARIIVRLHTDASQLTLDIEDDGPGFVPGTAGSGGGLGLVGMKERAALCGADLVIDSQPGEGARILLTVVFDELQQKETAD